MKVRHKAGGRRQKGGKDLKKRVFHKRIWYYLSFTYLEINLAQLIEKLLSTRL